MIFMECGVLRFVTLCWTSRGADYASCARTEAQHTYGVNSETSVNQAVIDVICVVGITVVTAVQGSWCGSKGPTSIILSDC